MRLTNWFYLGRKGTCILMRLGAWHLKIWRHDPEMPVEKVTK